MIIDFHTHCYTDEIAPRAMSLIPKHVAGPFFDGTLSGLCGHMAQNKIDYSVALNIANKPEHTVNVNNWAIACASAAGVIPFGSINPFYADYKNEIRRLKDHGIKGLKFHPYYQRYEVDDKAAYPVYEACAAAGFVMLFHAGLDSMAAGEYGTSDKLARVAGDLQYERMVAAHLGGSLTLSEAADCIWGKKIYLDTSLAFRFLSDEDRRRLLEVHGRERLLFGTDAPWADCRIDFDAFDKCEWLDKETRDMIFYKNAVKLLGL